MVCTSLGDFGMTGWSDFLVYPTSCDYFFYAKILGGLFFVLVLALYFGEKKLNIKPDILSILGVCSLGIWFLSLIGTLIKSSGGIPMIQQDIFMYVTAFAIVFCGIWFFKD